MSTLCQCLPINVCSIDHAAQITIQFGSFSPSQGPDESCANHLKAGNYSLSRFIPMIAGLHLQVHDDSDEYTAMNFDTISQMLPFDTPFVPQEWIDEFQRRMRRNPSCKEISWDLMASMYSKDKAYWNNKLVSNAVTELADDDPDDHHSHHFRAEDVIFMMEAFKLVKNSDGTNLRAVLRNLYPSTLNESAVLVSLAVWKENISLSATSDIIVDRQSCRRGPIDTDVILSRVLSFAFPDYDALRGELRREAVVAVELGIWKSNLPQVLKGYRYHSNGYHPMSNERQTRRQQLRPPRELTLNVCQYLFPDHVIKRGEESQPQAVVENQAVQQPAANDLAVVEPQEMQQEEELEIDWDNDELELGIFLPQQQPPVEHQEVQQQHVVNEQQPPVEHQEIQQPAANEHQAVVEVDQQC